MGTSEACAAESRSTEPRIQSAVNTEPHVNLSSEERRNISLAGGRILKHVDQARLAIKGKKKGDALSQIDKALTLVQILERSIPRYTVKTTIKAGELNYEDTDEVQPLRVPIYDEIDQVSILGPVEQAKRQEAEKAHRAGTPIVREVRLEHTRAELDLAHAKAELEDAKKALEEEHWDVADTALMSIQTDVVFTYIATDLPLEEARKNLSLARELVLQGRFGDAQLALQQASTALLEYEKAGAKEHSSRIQAIRKEMDEVRKTMDTKKNAKETAAKIMDWWGEITAWFRTA
ncbi:YfdX family protein [Candidatus Nitrospira bockiana]